MSFDNFSTTLTRIADSLGHESLLLAEARHSMKRVCRLTDCCAGRVTTGFLRCRFGRQSSGAGELQR